MNELHPDAMSTYLSNRPALPVAQQGNQVNDILELTRDPMVLADLAKRLKSEYGEIDLVVGGPPCQGYSGIGHRRSFDISKEEIPTNHLYRDMADFVSAIGPKAFIFENVRGLLNSKWTPEGSKGEIWNDVQKAFHNVQAKIDGRALNYQIHWELLFAKDFGVPQNRPRVIMIGVREDINRFNSAEVVSLIEGRKRVRRSPDPIEFLGDLVDATWEPGGSTGRYPSESINEWQDYFRRDPNSGQVLIRGDIVSDHEYAKHSALVIAKFQYMIDNGGALADHMQTKKFAQRLIPPKWGDRGPFITATSLADDYVHFSQPRVLTVREWARLQTFPDWYKFVGKRTTGGRRRAGDPSIGQWSRDLPKYTQIGNAVPVQLAKVLGEIVLEMID